MRYSTSSCLKNDNKMTIFLWICFVTIFTLPENGEGQLIMTATPDSPACGDDIVLRCQYVVALGTSSATVKWKKNSTTIISPGSSVDPLKYEERQRSEDSEYFELVISNFQPGDRDTYSCHYKWFLAVLALSCSEDSESFRMVQVASTLIGKTSEALRNWILGLGLAECTGGCLLDDACETAFYRQTGFGETCSTFASNASFIDYTGVDTVIHMRKEKGNGQLKLSVRRASFLCGYPVVLKCVFQGTFNSSAFRMWRTYIGAMSFSSNYQENLDDVESNVIEMTIRQFNALDRNTYSIQYDHDFARIDISCTYGMAFSTCDSIYENLPYGGTNSVILDQLFSHVCDSISDPGLYKLTENQTPFLFDISTVDLSWIAEDQQQCFDTCYKNETCGDVFYIQTSVKACVFRPFELNYSLKNIPIEHVHMKKTSDIPGPNYMINASTTHIGNITEVLESWIVSSLSECAEKCLEHSSCRAASYTRAGIETCAIFGADQALVNATEVTQYQRAYKRRNRNEYVRFWSPNEETGASGTVAEDIKPGTPILTIKTVDPDLEFIGFSLSQTPGSPKFTLRGNFDREVLAPQGLDAESEQTFTLNIRASDSLTLMSQKYNITITDVNEFAPVFSHNTYEVTIASGIVAGTVILTVLAIDQDVTSHVSHSITGGNDLGIFAIDKDTGNIIVANPQYFDSATLEHVLAVQASDGERSALVTAVIWIAGDLPPVFKTPRAASGTDKGNVSESAPAHTAVLTLESTYHDTYIQTITYGIQSQTPDSPVFILGGDENRTLLTPSWLDAEQVQSFQFNFSFTEGTAIFYSDVYTLTILDVNDNSPVFSSPSYTVYISPSVDAETPVLIVTATDHDITSILTYTILAGNEEEIFAIEGNTGAVTIKNRDKIDWPTSATYSLIIQVSDGEKVTAVVASLINEGTTENGGAGADNPNPTVAIAAGVGTGIVAIILIVVLIVVVRRRQASKGQSSKPPVPSPRPTDVPTQFTYQSNTDGMSNQGYVLPNAPRERELPSVPGENAYIEISDLQETPISEDYLTPVSGKHQSAPESNVYDTLSPDLSGDPGYDNLATQRTDDNRSSGYEYALAV